MSNIYEALKKAKEEGGQESLLRIVDKCGIQPSDRGKKSLDLNARTQKVQEEQGKPFRRIITSEAVYKALDDRLVTFSDPRSPSAEQVRKLRTLLYHLHKAKGLNLIMVTSALPEEGKTLIACNLGAAITQGLDYEAFLIDCDLKKPDVHRFFGVTRKPGLAEFLRGRRHFSQVTRSVPGMGLKIIPAGGGTEEAGELVSSGKMANFVRQLQAKYADHFIIIDSTPVLLAAEAAALTHLVDGIILVVLAHKTSRNLVKRALKEIDKEKIIGIVANGVEFKSGYYSKYHHNYYLSQ